MSMPNDAMRTRLDLRSLDFNAIQQATDEINAPVGKGLSETKDIEDHPELTATQSRQTPPGLPAPKSFSVEDMTLALMALKSKINDTQQEMSATDIKKMMAKMSDENEERVKAIEDSIAKMDQAKKAGVFGKVFGWIATIATVVTAAALCVTGVGAVVGGLLITGAVVALGMQIAQEIPAVQDWMSQNPAFGYVMLGVQVALAIVTAGAGLGSALAGVGKAAADISVKVIAQLIAALSTVVGGLSTVGVGGANIASSVYNKEAGDAQADAKKIEAELLNAQAAVDEEMKRLRKMMEEVQEGFSICMDIMNNATQAKQTVAQKLAV